MAWTPKSAKKVTQGWTPKSAKKKTASQSDFDNLENMSAEQVKEYLASKGGREEVDGYDEYTDKNSDDENLNKLWSGNRGLLQGLTMNLGDEAEAGIKSVFNDKSYDENVKSIRTRNKNASDNYGGSYLTGELTGGMASGTGAAFELAAIPKIANMGRMSKAATLAGAEGATTGFGAGEGIQDSLIKGGVTGTAGLVLGPTAEKAGDLLSMVKGTYKGKLPARKVDSIIREKKLNVDDLKQRANESVTDDIALVDLDPSLQDEVAGLAFAPGKAADKTKDVLTGRHSEQHNRIKSFTRKHFGVDNDAVELANELAEKKTLYAGEAYDEAYKAHPTVTPSNTMKNMIDLKTASHAKRQAIDWYEAETGIDISLDNASEVTDTRFWGLFKQAIDKDVKKALKDENGTGAHILEKKLLKPLVDEMEGQAPLWGQANDTFAAFAKAEKALAEGQKILQPSYKVDPKKLAQMDEYTKKHYDAGVIESIVNKVNTTAIDGDSAGKLINKQDSIDRIKKVFGDKADTFLKMLDEEKMMAKTQSSAFAGSNTVNKAASIKNASGSVRDATDLANGNYLRPLLRKTIAGRGLDILENSGRKNLEHTANGLLTQGKDDIIDLLSKTSDVNEIRPILYGLLNAGNTGLLDK